MPVEITHFVTIASQHWTRRGAATRATTPPPGFSPRSTSRTWEIGPTKTSRSRLQLRYVTFKYTALSDTDAGRTRSSATATTASALPRFAWQRRFQAESSITPVFGGKGGNHMAARLPMESVLRHRNELTSPPGCLLASQSRLRQAPVSSFLRSAPATSIRCCKTGSGSQPWPCGLATTIGSVVHRIVSLGIDALPWARLLPVTTRNCLNTAHPSPAPPSNARMYQSNSSKNFPDFSARCLR